MWSKKRIVWFVLMIATMAVIFYFSNQNGEKSNEVGNTVAQAMNITPVYKSVDESHTEILFGLHLRKWAHIGLFALLGLTAWGWAMSWKRATFVCVCYALLDEIHQNFVAGREARVKDILLDLVGAVAIIAVLEIFRKIRKRYERKQI